MSDHHLARLFGTDGVRGVAGEDHGLTPELVTQLVRAAVRQLPRNQRRVLVVRDTRGSGDMFKAAAAAGVMAAGGDAFLAGVLPTPAAPRLLRIYECYLAVVISASHNPAADNGIKFFGADGYKLDDDAELRIEAELDAPVAPPTRFGSVHHLDRALEEYVGQLHERFVELNLRDWRVLLDCANGAAYRAAPQIFRNLGADVTTLAADPDGLNINDDMRFDAFWSASSRPWAPATTTSRLRSTATPTACWRSIATESRWTVTSFWRWPPFTCASATGFPATAS